MQSVNHCHWTLDASIADSDNYLFGTPMFATALVTSQEGLDFPDALNELRLLPRRIETELAKELLHFEDGDVGKVDGLDGSQEGILCGSHGGEPGG